MNKDLLSYLKEVQELADSEFGIQEIPDVWHTFEFTEDEIMIIFFAVKHYLSKITMEGASIAAASTMYKLIDRLIPQVQQFTKNKIQAMNRVRPDNHLEIEDEWEEHNRNYNQDISNSIKRTSIR